MFFLKQMEIANVLQGCFWCDVLWKNLRFFARGQRCQNKVSFDRPHPEQIKTWSKIILSFTYVYIYICISFYFSLFLYIYLYFFSWWNMYFHDFSAFSCDFWTNQAACWYCASAASCSTDPVRCLVIFWVNVPKYPSTRVRIWDRYWHCNSIILSWRCSMYFFWRLMAGRP